MIGLVAYSIVEPTCFGSQEIFAVSADCAQCKSYERCEREIDINNLLATLPSDDDHDEKPALALVEKPTNTVVPISSGGTEAEVEGTSAYAFPKRFSNVFESYTDADLISTLSVLIARAFRGSAPLGYGAVRDEICAINLEMNVRQLVAPRFRPMQKLAQKPLPGDETNMALDRQVIDIHWRAFSKSKPHATV